MRLLLAREDGSYDEVDSTQREAHEVLGGPVQIVGAIDELNVVAAGLRDNDDLHANPFCGDKDRFEDDVRGPVLFVASDAQGDEIDVNVEVLINVIVPSLKDSCHQ
jgi:hypothetical protein